MGGGPGLLPPVGATGGSSSASSSTTILVTQHGHLQPTSPIPSHLPSTASRYSPLHHQPSHHYHHPHPLHHSLSSSSSSISHHHSRPSNPFVGSSSTALSCVEQPSFGPSSSSHAGMMSDHLQRLRYQRERFHNIHQYYSLSSEEDFARQGMHPRKSSTTPEPFSSLSQGEDDYSYSSSFSAGQHHLEQTQPLLPPHMASLARRDDLYDPKIKRYMAVSFLFKTILYFKLIPCLVRLIPKAILLQPYTITASMPLPWTLRTRGYVIVENGFNSSTSVSRLQRKMTRWLSLIEGNIETFILRQNISTFIILIRDRLLHHHFIIAITSRQLPSQWCLLWPQLVCHPLPEGPLRPLFGLLNILTSCLPCPSPPPRSANFLKCLPFRGGSQVSILPGSLLISIIAIRGYQMPWRCTLTLRLRLQEQLMIRCSTLILPDLPLPQETTYTANIGVPDPKILEDEHHLLLDPCSVR